MAKQVTGQTRGFIDEIRAADLDKLGFVEDPFSQAADPRYLFLGSEHLPIYRQIQRSIGDRRGLAVITGAPGTGKSSLAKRFFDVCNADSLIDVAYIPRTSFDTKFHALRTISNAFLRMVVPVERSYENQLESLKLAIADVHSKEHNVVVIFDDAQLMSRVGLSIIHELYNFEDVQKTVTSLVFGESDTINVIRKNGSVYSRMYLHLTLPPLSLASTILMIGHRVKTAGRTRPLIDDNAFPLIYDASGGIPRDVIFICSLATDIILQNELDIITQDVIREAINLYEQRKK